MFYATETLHRCNKHGCTPLYLAAQNGHANVAQYLIQTVGKNVIQPTSQMQWSPLSVAVDRADAATVNVLISGANKATEKVQYVSCMNTRQMYDDDIFNILLGEINQLIM
jgi:ankyrin repeat protein